jgi:hypothetical protein
MKGNRYGRQATRTLATVGGRLGRLASGLRPPWVGVIAGLKVPTPIWQ